MAVHILGIRHHGAGSARNVLEMLNKLQPDVLLVEGPPELDTVTKWVGHKELKPPVAVLGYNLDNPKQAVFYPFAGFSPEWQAISFANEKKIPVRMMDLPMAVSYQSEQNKAVVQEESPGEEFLSNQKFELAGNSFGRDPLSYFAEIGGYSNSEIWWEHHFEQKSLPEGNAEQHFEAVMLMMSTLRSAEIKSGLHDENIIREAYMREIIRKTQNEMFSTIVVICGAWHAPALTELDKTSKGDSKIIKSLPKTKIKTGTTWIPWTNERLAMFSGYGAGIVSPGWYEHLWHHNDDNGVRWLTRVARLLRKKKTDISTAHVIETFRLAESLAALRGLSKPGLYEFNESVQAVMCMGDGILLELIRKELIVAGSIGKVPLELPRHPLHEDFELTAKKLRLSATPETKSYELDLRKQLDLDRSIFLNRLEILNISWGTRTRSSGKGTFKEGWDLRWNPEMLISLIEMSIWGSNVAEASSNFLLEKSRNAVSVSEIAGLIEQAIPAELFVAIESLLLKINELSTISADVIEIMTALGPLVTVSRYGNVRKTDLANINMLTEGLITKICIGLSNACYGLDDETSAKMFNHIREVNESVRLLDNGSLNVLWQNALYEVLDKTGVNAIITGCTCRMLFDARKLDEHETALRFGIALSAGNEVRHSAGWIEGFLKGSGMILLLDNVLWNILYKWVSELPAEKFTELLPILRRTFSRFEVNERKQLGEKAKLGAGDQEILIEETDATDSMDHERGASVLGIVIDLLGIKAN